MKVAECQECGVGLETHKPYYMRYRICRECISKDKACDDGTTKRFCQQCGRYQDVALFSGTMRTCRERLERHAARRRKSYGRKANAEAAAAAVAHATSGSQQHRFVVQQQHQQQQHAAWNPTRRPAVPYQQQPAASNGFSALAGSIAPPEQGSLLTPLLMPTALRFTQPPGDAAARVAARVDPVAASSRLSAVVAGLRPAGPPQPGTAPPPPPPPPALSLAKAGLPGGEAGLGLLQLMASYMLHMSNGGSHNLTNSS